MNRRQKIIVSVTGIFLVLLLLVGLTYAYFLTQITGNINNKSISITTANLILEYEDGNGVLEPAGIILPGTDIEFIDADGKKVTSKTFSVENKGNDIVENYAVTVENYSLINATTGEEVTLKYPETLVINISCSSDKGDCNGLENAAFPESNDILLYNDIEVGEKQEYTLTMTYVDNGKDQSEDMNKSLSAKINIIDTNNTIDLVGEVETYNIGDYVQINSEPKTSRIVKNKDGKYTYKIVGVKPNNHKLGVYNKGTNIGLSELSIIKGTKSSVVGNTITITNTSRLVTINISNSYNLSISAKIEELLTEFSWDNAPEGSLLYAIKNNSTNGGLGSMEDDYGTSYFYYGYYDEDEGIYGVDNYLTYSNMCWRIVRVQGDGTIKLILADWEHACGEENGYSTNNNGSPFISDSTGKPIDVAYNSLKVTSIEKAKEWALFENGNIPALLNDWAIRLNLNMNKIVENEWCNDTSISSDSKYVCFNNGEQVECEEEHDEVVLAAISFGGGGGSWNSYLKCDMTGIYNSKSTKYKNKLGILSMDEYYIANFSTYENNSAYELSMTPGEAYYIGEDWNYVIGFVGGGDDAGSSGYVRPSIVLKSNVYVKTYNDTSTYGEPGTLNNPYVVK